MEKPSSKFSCIPIGLTQGQYNINSFNINDELKSSSMYSACLMAFIYIYLKNPLEWTSKTIDDIILFGAKLNTENNLERKIFGYVESIVNVNNYSATIKIQEPSFLDRLSSDDLYTHLEIFFTDNDFAIFQCSNLYYLIWKRVTVYYIFDAQGRNVRCHLEANAPASLICTLMLEDVCKLIKYDSGLRSDDCYAICGIKMKNLQENSKSYSELTVQYSDNETYTVLTNNRAILRGKIHIGNLGFKSLRNRQAMTVGLMALICNKIQPSNSWNSELVDKVILLGNKLFDQCANTGLGEVTLQQLPLEYSLKSYKCKNFYEPNRYIEFITDATKNDLLLTMKQAFKESTSYLVQVNTLVLAVWRNDSFYYLFDPYARNAVGQIPEDKFGRPCVHMVKTVNLLYSVISQILTNVAEEEKFVMHRVTLTLECLCGYMIDSCDLNDVLTNLCFSQMELCHDVKQNICNLNDSSVNEDNTPVSNETPKKIKSISHETDKVLEQSHDISEERHAEYENDTAKDTTDVIISEKTHAKFENDTAKDTTDATISDKII